MQYEVYRLGYEDAMQMKTEYQICSERSVLTAKVMEHLIYIYDAVKKLNATMLGSDRLHDREGGVLGTFERVFNVIKDGACSEIAMCGEEELDEYLMKVLDSENKLLKKRAESLLKDGNT